MKQFLKSFLVSSLVLMPTLGNAFQLNANEELAKIKSLTSNNQFPKALVKIKFIRHCSDKVLTTLVEQQTGAGKVYVQVGVVLQKTDLPCSMRTPVFITETKFVQVSTKLPIFKLDPIETEFDLIYFNGTSADNFINPK